MLNLRAWFNGKELDLSAHKMRMNLLEPEIEIPAKLQGKKVEVVLCCDTGYSQYAPDGNGGGGFYGKPEILVEKDAPGAEAEYCDGTVFVKSGREKFKVKHKLMEVE